MPWVITVIDAEALTSLRRIKDDWQAGWSAVRAIEHMYDRRDRCVRPEMASDASDLITPTNWLSVGFNLTGFCHAFGLNGHGQCFGLTIDRTTRPPPAKCDI